jgi:RsiW-degrading membrane proteinase PrsW (M82 family)
MNVVYALLAGILPALLWLLFWLREDNLHPEPRSLITGTFLSGMVVVVMAIFLEKYVADIITDEKYRYIAWAAIEEITKFLAVAIIALRSRHIDEPVDAMIYCITVALGFAALENALFILSPLETGDITRSIVTGNMRFIGATLVHVVCSAVIGFMIGLSFYKNAFIKALSLIFGVILAVTLHAGFNLSIINETVTNTLKVFGWVWLGVVILIILFEEVKAVRPKYDRQTV